MKAEDLGFDGEHTEHDPNPTQAEAVLLAILVANHMGKQNKIGADELALYWQEKRAGRRVSHNEYNQMIQAWKRDLRYLVNHLVIDHDQAILSKAGSDGGYWIGEEQSEVDEFYETFRRRAMTALTKAARGRKAVLAETIKQLTFAFEDLKAERKILVRPHMQLETAPVMVVTALIDKMTKEPEKFSREIELLREKFGKVLMPKEMFEEIRATSQRLQQLVERIS